MADAALFHGGKNFAALIADYIGETVTIFTTSGGQSGSGFTGVVLSVNDCFVRLLTRIGPPPGCSLGNACSGFQVGNEMYRGGCGSGYGYYSPAGYVGAIYAGGWNGYPVSTVGSVTDIPIDRIVSFVHNAV
ncbi:MAG: hypothetical protein ACOX6S_01710 [Clostridia bacterium]|jgi:hypothetical protein